MILTDFGFLKVLARDSVLFTKNFSSISEAETFVSILTMHILKILIFEIISQL